MRAGKLRHRVSIYYPEETQDATGSMVQNWLEFATVWASVEPLRGREMWAAREKEARIDVRIRMRYIDGITAKMIVILGSHTYQIVSIIDEEMRHAALQLMCYEVTDV